MTRVRQAIFTAPRDNTMAATGARQVLAAEDRPTTLERQRKYQGLCDALFKDMNCSDDPSVIREIAGLVGISLGDRTDACGAVERRRLDLLARPIVPRISEGAPATALFQVNTVRDGNCLFWSIAVGLLFEMSNRAVIPDVTGNREHTETARPLVMVLKTMFMARGLLAESMGVNQVMTGEWLAMFVMRLLVQEDPTDGAMLAFARNLHSQTRRLVAGTAFGRFLGITATRSRWWCEEYYANATARDIVKFYEGGGNSEILDVDDMLANSRHGHSLTRRLMQCARRRRTDSIAARYDALCRIVREPVAAEDVFTAWPFPLPEGVSFPDTRRRARARAPVYNLSDAFMSAVQEATYATPVENCMAALQTYTAAAYTDAERYPNAMHAQKLLNPVLAPLDIGFDVVVELSTWRRHVIPFDPSSERVSAYGAFAVHATHEDETHSRGAKAGGHYECLLQVVPQIERPARFIRSLVDGPGIQVANPTNFYPLQAILSTRRSARSR